MATQHHVAGSPLPATPKGLQSLWRAWVSLALLPVGFVLATLLGDWLLSLQGYQSEDTIPLTAALWAAGPALLVLIAPAVGAVMYGLRARARGRSAGLVVAVIGCAVALGTIALNVLAFAFAR
ncbi:hypothetical protein [Flindersiella endophytica]